MCHPDLRPGDQPAAPQGQPQRARADDGRGDRASTGAAATTRVTLQGSPALRQRELHRLRRLRQGRERRDRQSLQLRPGQDARRPTCRTPWPIRSATCSIRRIVGTAEARKGQGGLQVRRHRSRHEGRDDRRSTSAPSSGPPAGGPTTRRRSSPTATTAIANVITSVEFERLADPHGPTGGKLLRPSDGKEAKNIAFIQCAGSRDENHLRHCSRICCMASLKQTQYVREAYGDDGKSTIYYIDIRAIDRFEDFYAQGAEGPDGELRQVQGRAHRRGRGQRQPGPARRRHRGLPPLRDASTTSWCWRSAWSRKSTASSCPTTSSLDSCGLHRRLDATAACSAPAAATSPLDVNRAVQSATAAALRAIQVVTQGRASKRRARESWPRRSTPPTSAPAAASATRSTSAQLEKIAQQGRQDGAGARATPSCAAPRACRLIRDDIANEGVTHVVHRRLLAPRQDRGLPLSRPSPCRAPTCAKA